MKKYLLLMATLICSIVVMTAQVQYNRQPYKIKTASEIKAQIASGNSFYNTLWKCNFLIPQNNSIDGTRKNTSVFRIFREDYTTLCQTMWSPSLFEKEANLPLKASPFKLQEQDDCYAIIDDGSNMGFSLLEKERIIADISDSLLILTSDYYIVEHKDGKYAHYYDAFFPKNRFEDTTFVKKYTYKLPLYERALYAALDTTGLSFNIKKWFEKNIAFPKNYKGDIISGNINGIVYFDLSGNIVDIFFLFGADGEIINHIRETITKKMPHLTERDIEKQAKEREDHTQFLGYAFKFAKKLSSR